MKFCWFVLELHLSQNFCYRHAFLEIVKSCSGHPKTCKSIRNQKSKIFSKPTLSSIYTEESKNLVTLISMGDNGFNYVFMIEKYFKPNESEISYYIRPYVRNAHLNRWLLQLSKVTPPLFPRQKLSCCCFHILKGIYTISGKSKKKI